MDGNVVAFFVPTVVFIIVVLPLWLFMHYRTKQRADIALSQADRDDLQTLMLNADRMVRRIDTLESILDAESPGWRQRMANE